MEYINEQGEPVARRLGLRNHIEQEEEVSCPIFHSLLLPAKHSVVEILGCGNIRLWKMLNYKRICLGSCLRS